MPEASTREIAVFPVALLVSIVALAVGLLCAGAGDSSSAPALDASVTRVAIGRPLPDGFLGLSLEYGSIESYAGNDPAHLNPVFLQLLRNLTPGQRPVLRIGGDTADWSWWPVPGMARPPGVTYTLGPQWLAVTRALATSLGARLMLGLNLEADSGALAAAEQSAFENGLPSASLLPFELGNEPELYRSFPWYRDANGHGVKGRAPGYDVGAFLSDFSRVSSQLTSAPLAGPTIGGSGWLADLPRFLDAEPQVRLVTVHRYPLQLCYTAPASPRYPTVAHLLAPAASEGLAESFAGALEVAHEHGFPLRIDELNTVACGADPAVSRTFASALWAIDTLFALDRLGVDGVHIHTFPGAGYELFTMARTGGAWSAQVAPEYYGLMMFASAAPVGSRLLAVSAPGAGALRLWATAGADGRIRVVAINTAVREGRTVRLRVAGAHGDGTLVRLRAPGVTARRGVTLGGQSFAAPTRTARLAGASDMARVAPDGGRYEITVPAGSAALLTVTPGATSVHGP